MKLVLDTATIVAAIRSDRGAARVLLIAGLQKRFEMLVSVPLAFEYEAVMTRPEHLAASGLILEDMRTLLDQIGGAAVPVRVSFQWRPTLTDPDDDMVLEAAVNGQADAIVTFNTRDFATVAAGFGVDVLSPPETLKRWRHLL